MVSAYWTSALRLKKMLMLCSSRPCLANAKPCLTSDVVEILNKINKTQIIQYLYHPQIHASVWTAPIKNFLRNAHCLSRVLYEWMRTRQVQRDPLELNPLERGIPTDTQPVGAHQLCTMSANPFSKVPNGAMSSVGDKSSLPYAANEEPANYNSSWPLENTIFIAASCNCRSV